MIQEGDPTYLYQRGLWLFHKWFNYINNSPIKFDSNLKLNDKMYKAGESLEEETTIKTGRQRNKYSTSQGQTHKAWHKFLAQRWIFT